MCVCVSHLLYPLMCWCTFSLLPCLDYCKWTLGCKWDIAFKSAPTTMGAVCAQSRRPHPWVPQGSSVTWWKWLSSPNTSLSSEQPYHCYSMPLSSCDYIIFRIMMIFAILFWINIYHLYLFWFFMYLFLQLDCEIFENIGPWVKLSTEISQESPFQVSH